MLDKNNLKEFILYFIVGGIATIIEWVIFYMLDSVFDWYYIPATVIAYILSTLFNWLLGRIILFKNSNKNLFVEILTIYGASIIGLVLNLIIMWIAIDFLSLNEILSKIIATGFVFIWNFAIRKLVIYN